MSTRFAVIALLLVSACDSKAKDAERDPAEPTKEALEPKPGAAEAGDAKAPDAAKTAEAEPADTKAAGAETAGAKAGGTLKPGYMHWVPDRPIVDATALLVVGGKVRSLATRPATEVEGGGTITIATIDIEKVFRDEPGSGPTGVKPENRFAGATVLEAEDLSGAKQGDLVVVFMHGYEGDYAIIPKSGTTTKGGLVVASWDEPIVGAIERWGQGKSKLPDEDEAKIWAPYGEGEIECFIEQLEPGLCAGLGREEARELIDAAKAG